MNASKRIFRQTAAAIGSILGADRRETELPSARSVRKAVELEFGIRATRVREIHSRENGVWRIDSPQGPWVAKAFPPTESLERVRRELRLYRWLASRDVSVPQYRTRPQGGEIAKVDKNDHSTLLVLMRYEQLTHLRPDSCEQGSITGIGREIATAHAILRDYPDVHLLTPDLYGNEAPDTDYKRRGNFKVVQTSEPGQSFRRSHIAELKAIDSRVEDYLVQEKLPPNLTRSVIHGDLYLANISIRPNERAFLFDWEAIQAPIAVDLAVLCVNLYTARNISIARWETLRQWLFAAYESRMPLTESDLRSIPLFTLRSLLDLVRIYCEPAASFTSKADVVKRCYQLADYLLQDTQYPADKA